MYFIRLFNQTCVNFFYTRPKTVTKCNLSEVKFVQHPTKISNLGSSEVKFVPHPTLKISNLGSIGE
jgi:hypothetical protein